MGYARFQADWEEAAGAEYDAYLAVPAAALIDLVRAGRYGDYYQLWRAIAARCTPAEAGEVLLGTLRGDEPYLIRYHAAAALLTLLGVRALEPADLAAERVSRLANIDAVERRLRELVAD